MTMTNNSQAGHISGYTEMEASTVQHFPKPAEGTWTEAFGLDFEPISSHDNISPEWYELEKEAVFRKSWLYMGRIEDLPRRGTFFTREIDMFGYSIVIARGMDDKIRAFHNVCSHRGNQLVWEEDPKAELKGSCRQFTCKYHGWRYALDGEVAYVHNAPEFQGLTHEGLKLPEIHCDVFASFIFVNLSKTPPCTLREFMGDDLWQLEQYPFHKLTEHHQLEAIVNSNWKLFVDAFAEFYHVPYVHAKLNNPKGGDLSADKPPFMVPWFQRYGKHRMLSSGGQFANTAGRGLLPSQNVFKATIHGPFNPPDLGPLGSLSNPGKLQGWGMDMWQIYPNFVCMTWSRNTLVMYQYWPLAHNQHKFIFDYYFVPPTSVSERLMQEMVVAVSKDFALQDANVLEATQRRMESKARTHFHYADQEVLLRHLHKVVENDVKAYQAELAQAQGKD